MKLFSRLKLMSERFRKNPITKNRQAKAMRKYIVFNVLCRLKTNIICNGIEGMKFVISKGDSGLVGNVYFGVYEVNESMFMLHFLRDHDTFLDIGANIGHYSILASGLTNAKSISVEPIPSTIKKFQKQIDINNLNDKITPMNIGLSDKISNLYFSSDNKDMNHIVNSEYPNAIKIPVSTMDNICQNKNISIIKIDVEGYEKFVLQGGEKTLNNPNLKTIIVELNNSGSRYGINDLEVYNKLLTFGFLPYEYLPLTREILQLESYNKKQFNTIFIRDLEYVKNRIRESKKYKVWDLEI